MTTGRAMLRFFRRSETGAAAAEFALIIAAITPPLPSIVDLGIYAYRRTQVEMAAEAAVQSIRGACTPEQSPVTRNCATGLLSRITTAAQSTSLGTNVTVASGSPVEGYYCLDASGQLQLVGTAGTISAPLANVPSSLDCNAYGRANSAPGDYVQVTVNYTNSPLFPGASVVSLLPATVTRTGWYRVK